MKVIYAGHLPEDQIVISKAGGFKSERFLVGKDGAGYTVTRTTIEPDGVKYWHYKNHIESCYCVEGVGILRDIKTGEEFEISPGVLYCLDQNDPHEFEALEKCVLICVFSPALEGREVHGPDGSYEI
ncbi:MAG: ectoine synthase [Bacteroidetes bacterium]|nr:ectoine synthase [Bacteroidota bacterium]